MQQNTFRPSRDPRPEMELALERAIELSVGRKQYTIVDGRLIYEQHRRYRYAFTLELPWDLPDGTDFQLQSADFDHLLVELSNTKDECVTITITQRLPERTLFCARLVIERAYLLRKMKEVLAQLHASTGLGLKLFGYRDCIEETAASSLLDTISDVFVPDDAQRLAIQRALGSEVQMILGPGGTGKTDVLAAIAMLHAVLYKRQVLIASHTNIAIDNAMIRLATFFRKHGMGFFLDEQNLVRAGSPHLAELETDAYRHVTLSLIVNDAIEQQRKEIARLERRRKKVLSDIVTHQEVLPGQARAWNQRQKELLRQQKQVQTEQESLEVEEQAPIKVRQRRALVEDVLAHLDQHAEEAKRDAARFVLESAQVVGTTLTGLYLNSTLLNQHWDVVIIDEGSMAPPPAVMIAAQCASNHVIVVGDPLQLAPVCKIRDPNVPRWQHDQDIVQHWLGRDVFYHGGYTLQQAGSGTHHCVLLPYQSRMHSDICDLVRGLIYQGLLKDRHPSAPRPRFGPEPDHPVVLYDTGGTERALALKPKSGRSRYNPYHAEVAIKLAGRALADMPDKRPECVGIVTPYAAQRDYIKELIRGTALETYARVGTVHAFQGLEFDVLVFDTVESPGIRISRFTSDRWGTDAMRLLNVAVTRARHKLLIVANMAYIRQEPASHLLPQMMELACQKKCVPAETLGK